MDMNQVGKIFLFLASFFGLGIAGLIFANAVINLFIIKFLAAWAKYENERDNDIQRIE